MNASMFFFSPYKYPFRYLFCQMGKCECCHRLYVVQDEGRWYCFFCDSNNKTSWKCDKQHFKRVSWCLERVFDDYADEIVPGIFVGEELAATVPLKQLQQNNISRILSLGTYKKVHEASIAYLQVPLLDDEVSSLLDHVEKCIDFINKRPPKTGILIHCRAGVSRSPSVMIAWLISQRKMTFLEAFELVERKRPCVSPNPLFIEQLQTFQVSRSCSYDL